MMSLNRYRLNHQANSGDSRARRVLRLLARPDRLIGVILIGNDLVNSLGAAIATVIAIGFFGEVTRAAVGPLALTSVLLILSEVSPKPYAAIKPERIAYPAQQLLQPPLKLL